LLVEGRRIVVAIDGPAGAGKSTLARLLARDLGYAYIDTGAMYRTVGLLASRARVLLDDGYALSKLVEGLTFEFPWIEGELHTIANGEDVSGPIRSPQAAMDASRVSTVRQVREALVALQRFMGAHGGVVMEGRDIGTVVFPDAELKVFLTASARMRGKRRQGQMRERGEEAELETIIAQIKARDLADSSREHSPLRPAADGVLVDTSQLPIERVRNILFRLAKSRINPDTA
jgi:cytidylate kinase